MGERIGVRFEPAGDLERGLWCETCSLPAGIRGRLVMVGADGECTPAGTFSGCAECDRTENGQVFLHQVGRPTAVVNPVASQLCDRCLTGLAEAFCCVVHGRALCAGCAGVHG